MALQDPACEFVFLLNNDTVVHPNALSLLKAKMLADLSIAACGPTLLFYDRPDRVQGLGGRWEANIARAGHIGLGLSHDKLPPVEKVEADMSYVMGAALFMRRSLIERFRRIYDDYFLYFEELEIAAHVRRDERQGWCPDALVYHKEGASIGTGAEGRQGDRSLYYLSVNLLRYHMRHAPLRLPIALLRLARESYKHARAGDQSSVKIIRTAVVDFFTRTYRRQDFLGNPR